MVEANRQHAAVRAAAARPIWRVENGHMRQGMSIGHLDGELALISLDGHVQTAVPLRSLARIEVTDAAARKDRQTRSPVVGTVLAGPMIGTVAGEASRTYAYTSIVATCADWSFDAIVLRGEAAVHRARLAQAVAGQVAIVG